MAKTKEDIYRDKLSHLHDQLTVQGYRLQKIAQACGQDDGPLVDLVTREQAAKIIAMFHAGSAELKVDEATLAKRREAWVCPPPNVTKGYLARYAKLVSSANKGAIVE